MNNQEKNERLARWAGFKPRQDGCQCEKCTTAFPMLYPDGDIGPLPDFLTDLNAQARWLWPKLVDWKLEPEWKPLSEHVGKTGRFRAFVQVDDVHGCVAIADTPAAACAKAILKLIGEKP